MSKYINNITPQYTTKGETIFIEGSKDFDVNKVFLKVERIIKKSREIEKKSKIKQNEAIS